MTAKAPDTAAWLQDVAADDLRRMFDVLYRVHRLVACVTDLKVLLERVMQESKQVAAAEACSLMLFDPYTEELYFEVALGESGDQGALMREVRLKLGQGIAGVAAATRETVNVEDVRQDERFFTQADETSNFETRSLLAVPLVDRDQLIGVLEVVNKLGGQAFSTADQHIMEIFGGLVATSIANARLIEDKLRAERLAVIGQAVAGLSHHTKNIITGLSGSVDLIDQGLRQNNSEFLERSWPIFKRSTRRIADFVEDMLTFSKPRKPILEPCDLKAVVEDVCQTVSGSVAKKHITIEIDTAELAGPVTCESRGIYRCLLNLVSNAVDAVPASLGRVRISARTTDAGAVLIDVADNGKGVPVADEKRIFDPFYSTKGARGTGLGLAVTQKIIAEHRGQVSVMRAPEGGALFRIVLPPGNRQSVG